MHRDSWKQVDKRQETDYVAHDEDGLELDEFIAVEAELIGHSRNVRIVYVVVSGNWNPSEFVLKDCLLMLIWSMYLTQ